MTTWASELGEQVTTAGVGASLADPCASKESAERGAQVQPIPVASTEGFWLPRR